MEKLIDDVMAFICEHGISAGQYVGFGRSDAKELITRIGKAYADGELELPNELGRFQQQRGKSVFREGTAMKLLWDGALLIAVGKEGA